jgi:glycosyltransferase involved in cell wall biosynthesis
VAPAGSHVAGTLVSIPLVQDPVTRSSWVAAHEACRAAIRDTLAREQVDLVHLHGVDFHAYLPAPGPIVLVTLHLPLDWYPAEALRATRPRTFLHGVSHTQMRACPPGVEVLEPIENGVDLQQLHPDGAPADYALVLGRICPEKGQHLALDAATRSGVPVVLAGQVFGYPEHEAYFREQIEPRLQGPHRFIGRVTGDAKVRLIARARCLIVPSVVDETSSLVAMEALACGRPVIAFRRGALVELVEDGVTGWLVADVDELARALRDCDRIDPARCRAVAEARCSRARMSTRYLARYEALVADATA